MGKKVTTDQIISIANLAVPAIMSFVQAHQASHNGQIPTIEQVQAQITVLGDRVIEDIEAWQESHRK